MQCISPPSYVCSILLLLFEHHRTNMDSLQISVVCHLSESKVRERKILKCNPSWPGTFSNGPRIPHVSHWDKVHLEVRSSNRYRHEIIHVRVSNQPPFAHLDAKRASRTNLFSYPINLFYEWIAWPLVLWRPFDTNTYNSLTILGLRVWRITLEASFPSNSITDLISKALAISGFNAKFNI